MGAVEKATPEQIIEGLADAVGLTTLEGRFLYVNAEFERSTGWRREEVVGRTAEELGVLSAEEFRSIGTEVVPRLRREGFVRNTEMTTYRRDGTAVPVRMSWALVRGPDGTPSGLLNIVTDISEQKRAEAALRASEERWRALVEDSPDIVITTDPSGKILFASRAVCGISPSDVIGTQLVDCFGGEQKETVLEVMAAVAGSGKTGTFEFEMTGEDGHRSWQSARVGVIRGRETIRGFAVVSTDVTERKRLERARDQYVERVIAEQDEERRRIARELHDETGQSLAALTIGLQTLELSIGDETVRKRCRDLRELVETTAEDVRRLARGLHPSILDDLGFCAAMRRHAEDYAQAHGIEVDLELRDLEGSGSLPRTLEIALYRVAQEALTNTARHSGAARAIVRVRRTGSSVELCVEDDGIGIEATRRARADETPQAVGLGLVAIRERIALLDGTVEIGPREGGGTRVCARVPLRGQ